MYTVVFLEQRSGVSGVVPVAGDAGTLSFPAADDECAMQYIADTCIDRLKRCECAELSSMQIVADPTGPGGMRLLDDSLIRPHFQETYIRYNAVDRCIDIDFDATQAALAPLGGSDD